MKNKFICQLFAIIVCNDVEAPEMYLDHAFSLICFFLSLPFSPEIQICISSFQIVMLLLLAIDVTQTKISTCWFSISLKVNVRDPQQAPCEAISSSWIDVHGTLCEEMQ